MNFRKKNPQLSNFVKIGPVGFSWHIFEKILKYQISWKSAQWDFLERFSKKPSNIKFRENRPSGIFSTDFRKNPQISNFVKIGPVGFSREIFEKILKYQISWKAAQWDFLERFSKKSSNIKFRENRPSGIFSTDFRKRILKYQISWESVQWKPSCSVRRRDEADSPFMQFCESLFQILKCLWSTLATF